jgi:drug/metabolite transporter (DMT)-like permease
MRFDQAFLRFAPLLFVFIWSTGWLAAGYAAPHADALTFLSVRFVCATALLAGLALIAGVAWPRDWRGWAHPLIAGALLHGLYLSGVWWSVRAGLPAGVSGVIAGLQPILTAAFAPLLVGERITPMRWLGIAIGFAGILLVLAPKLGGVPAEALWAVALPMLVNIAGMFAVTFGSFYQKRFQPGGDLRTMTAVQYLGALAVTLPLAFLLEPMRIAWNTTTVLTLAWSVVGLSLGGIWLYLMLIRKGEVSRAATLIYLVPPVVALQTWALFGEVLSPLQWAGIGLTALGVALAARASSKA